MTIIFASESAGWQVSRYIPPGTNPNVGGSEAVYGPEAQQVAILANWSEPPNTDVGYELRAVGYSNIPSYSQAGSPAGTSYYFKGFLEVSLWRQKVNIPFMVGASSMSFSAIH